jgi:cytosine/adenosine deaminase-related metal-dependent hydrolase
MRAFAQRHPAVAPSTILGLATLNGAKALGQAGRLGELTPGAEADLVAIPFAGSPRTAFRAAVTHVGPVMGSMIQGRWAILPNLISE